MLHDTARIRIPESVKLVLCGEDSPARLTYMDTVHPLRVYAEAFVQEKFFKAYRARLHSFYPVLLATGPEGADFSAVAGIRPAGGEQLYSEHYLDVPVEQILNVDRSRVVEFGNLATASAGQARWLIIAMSAFIRGAGFTRVVFTAVPALYNAFRRLGLPLTKLADARRDLLPAAESTDWGSYYDSNPAVYTGDLLAGEDTLQEIARKDPGLYRLAQQAAGIGHSFARSKSAPLA